MTDVGYIWVGPLEHNSDYQRDILRQRGVTEFYEDISANSATPTRAQLTAALDEITPNDTLVVWRLDRLASTSAQVLSLLELLAGRGVGVRSITEGLDTGGPESVALLRFIHAFTDLEKTLIRERTMVGVYAARARGRVGGRPRALSQTNIERVAMLRDQGASVREIAQQLGTSRATVYRALEEQNAEPDDEEVGAESRASITLRFSTPSLPDLGSKHIADA
ncbi:MULTISPECIES: recombinase family protein [Subtercola]|uniref:Recombinase family protein n=1 Tax=Subtercola vilae TaxID=2056433 RepID=A0A4T2C077_9MICO|nr:MULTISPECIES: recombinase family protein [Subtercola]MEA9984648.1 recombinase family protein [Subtercola sp. RTI3]TIH35308.1 recombinase family protein [Subtercola vilae]